MKLHIRLGWVAGTAGLAGVLLAGCGTAAAPGLMLVRPFEPGRGQPGTAG